MCSISNIPTTGEQIRETVINRFIAQLYTYLLAFKAFLSEYIYLPGCLCYTFLKNSSIFSILNSILYNFSGSFHESGSTEIFLIGKLCASDNLGQL
jgi:hypothetical protein